MSPWRLRQIENDVAAVHGINTNYFNDRRSTVTQPAWVWQEQDGDRINVRWTTALAAAEPIASYNLYHRDRLLASLPYRPQLTSAPLETWVEASGVQEAIRVVASTDPPRRME